MIHDSSIGSMCFGMMPLEMSRASFRKRWMALEFEGFETFQSANGVSSGPC